MISERLDNLKRSLYMGEYLDVVSQCEIVAEAMASRAPYMENYEGLALFLGVSENKVYQMNYIHHNLLPSLKEWFRKSSYRCHTTFLVSRLTPLEQEKWLQKTKNKE